MESLLDKGAMESGRKPIREVVTHLLEGLRSISVFITTKIILCAEAGVHVCKSFVLGLHVGRRVLDGAEWRTWSKEYNLFSSCSLILWWRDCVGANAENCEYKGKSTDRQSNIGKDLRLFGNVDVVRVSACNSFCIAWAGRQWKWCYIFLRGVPDQVRGATA